MGEDRRGSRLALGADQRRRDRQDSGVRRRTTDDTGQINLQTAYRLGSKLINFGAEAKQYRNLIRAAV